MNTNVHALPLEPRISCLLISACHGSQIHVRVLYCIHYIYTLKAVQAYAGRQASLLDFVGFGSVRVLIEIYNFVFTPWGEIQGEIFNVVEYTNKKKNNLFLVMEKQNSVNTALHTLNHSYKFLGIRHIVHLNLIRVKFIIICLKTFPALGKNFKYFCQDF